MKNWQYSRDAAASLITLLYAEGHRHNTYNLGPSDAWALSEWCMKLAKRFPAFRWSIAEGADGALVGLWNPRDGGLLSGSRFASEFGPTARFDLHHAFDDYMEFLESPIGAEFQP